MNKPLRFLGAMLLTIALISILAPLLEAASASTRFQSPGTRVISRGLQVVPDSATSLSTTDTELYQITLGNTTGSACTFTLADRATSAKTIMTAVSIAANTTYVIAWPEGMFMSNGVTWSTGTTSCLVAGVKGLMK